MLTITYIGHLRHYRQPNGPSNLSNWMLICVGYRQISAVYLKNNVFPIRGLSERRANFSGSMYLMLNHKKM